MRGELGTCCSTAREASGWTALLGLRDLSFQTRKPCQKWGFTGLESTISTPGGLQVDQARDMAKLTPIRGIRLLDTGLAAAAYRRGISSLHSP